MWLVGASRWGAQALTTAWMSPWEYRGHPYLMLGFPETSLHCHGCTWAVSFSKAGVGACRDGEGCKSNLGSGIWRAYQLQKRH